MTLILTTTIVAVPDRTALWVNAFKDFWEQTPERRDAIGKICHMGPKIDHMVRVILLPYQVRYKRARADKLHVEAKKIMDAGITLLFKLCPDLSLETRKKSSSRVMTTQEEGDYMQS